MSCSIILLCWKRFDRFETILKFWLSQPKVDEVIVFDNSGQFKTDLPVTLINSNHNFNTGVRLPLVGLAKNEVVIFCDDDLELKDGIIGDFEKHYQPDRVLGVYGVKYDGENFFDSTRVKDPQELTEVDYTPYNLCMVNRRLCLKYDVFDCPNLHHLDDMWWEFQLRRDGLAKMFVIPSTNFSFTDENEDSNALHLNENVRIARYSYYKNYIKGKI